MHFERDDVAAILRRVILLLVPIELLSTAFGNVAAFLG